MIIEKKGRCSVDFLCYLFLVFLIGCFTGWVYEVIFYRYSEGMLRNRGILYGPWLPIYGIGAVGIYALKRFKKNPIVLFLLAAVISGVVEYVIGYVGVHFLNLRLWNYRGLFLNIQGIVCLRSVISFAIMGVIFHYPVEPVVEKLVGKLSPKLFRNICFVVAIIFLVDCVLSALFRTPITY